MMIGEKRTENPLLGRVEIRFRMEHKGKPTPNKKELIEAALRLEPGATEDKVVLTDINTRFGQAMTTGLALFYEEVEQLKKIEPKYILKKFGMIEEKGGE